MTPAACISPGAGFPGRLLRVQRDPRLPTARGRELGGVGSSARDGERSGSASGPGTSVQSADGTRIASDRRGSAARDLVPGGRSPRSYSSFSGLIPLLSREFTANASDRRGRGRARTRRRTRRIARPGILRAEPVRPPDQRCPGRRGRRRTCRSRSRHLCTGAAGTRQVTADPAAAVMPVMPVKLCSARGHGDRLGDPAGAGGPVGAIQDVQWARRAAARV